MYCPLIFAPPFFFLPHLETMCQMQTWCVNPPVVLSVEISRREVIKYQGIIHQIGKKAAKEFGMFVCLCLAVYMCILWCVVGIIYLCCIHQKFQPRLICNVFFINVSCLTDSISFPGLLFLCPSFLKGRAGDQLHHPSCSRL